MKITIEIETDNAAFRDGMKHRETRRILKGIVDRITNVKMTDGKIHDSNGNTVGKWEVTE